MDTERELIAAPPIGHGLIRHDEGKTGFKAGLTIGSLGRINIIAARTPLPNGGIFTGFGGGFQSISDLFVGIGYQSAYDIWHLQTDGANQLVAVPEVTVGLTDDMKRQYPPAGVGRVTIDTRKRQTAFEAGIRVGRLGQFNLDIATARSGDGNIIGCGSHADGAILEDLQLGVGYTNQESHVAVEAWNVHGLINVQGLALIR